MLLSWITLFVFGCIVTGLVLFERGPGVILSMLGFSLGIICVFGALSLQVSSGSGISSQPSIILAVISIMIIAINSISMFSSTITSITAGITGGR